MDCTKLNIVGNHDFFPNKVTAFSARRNIKIYLTCTHLMKRPNIKDDVKVRNCGINNNKTNLTLISLDHYWFQLQWKQSLDTTFLSRFGFCYGSSLSLLFQTVSILLLKINRVVVTMTFILLSYWNFDSRYRTI